MLDSSPSSNRWELYRVLSEPVRLQLLALAAEEELAIGELAELLGESQPNVSRHAAPLKQAGLVTVRKQGTRALVRLADDVARDAVISDALVSGRALCEANGSLARIADVLRARDAVGREFFARAGDSIATATGGRPPDEIGAYLKAIAPLLAMNAVAVDAGTGDGGLLDVLAPTFDRVVALDRSEAQLTLAKERVTLRGYENVRFVEGELDGAEVRAAVGDGADAVFAARLLHHAPRPAQVMRQLAELCHSNGAVVVLDYARHDDETMRAQADLWLGFEASELRKFARAAGLEDARVTKVPAGLCGKGPDAHLAWQVLVAKKTNARKTDGAKRDALPPKHRKANGHG